MAIGVSRKAAAGHYKIEYSLENLNDTGLMEKTYAEIDVPEAPGFILNIEQQSGCIVAGDIFQVTAAVTNTGNASLDLSFRADVDRGAYIKAQPGSINLDPSETQLVRYKVETCNEGWDGGISTVWLMAYGRAPGGRQIQEKAWCACEIVSNAGDEKQFRTVPSQLSLNGLSGYEVVIGQAELSGLGRMSDRYRIDYLARGPDAWEAVPFAEPEEYRMSIRSDRLELLAGDRTWRLSKLMNEQRYGRGAGVVVRPWKLETGAYILRSRWEERGTEIGSAWMKAPLTSKFDLQLSAIRKTIHFDADEIKFDGLSLSSDLRLQENVHFYLEYGIGGDDGYEAAANILSAAGFLGQLEGSVFERFRYSLIKIRSDPKFYGHYHDIEETRGFLSGMLLRGRTNVRMHVAAQQATRNLGKRPEFGLAIQDLKLITGIDLNLENHWFTRLSVGHGIRDDLLPGSLYEIKEYLARVSTGRYSGMSGFTLDGQTGIQHDVETNADTHTKSAGFNINLRSAIGPGLSLEASPVFLDTELG
ncbi:MAG: hypothetical protein KJ970_10065 [Candidatus Eisenbacteria bacterium]|uniref:CARDB domain-containing protein n=1 Tax=Eiseniibacteriota bacterium TaxID=2212470 RepID=A0A948RZV5_UNCEI|nr:hypothetical protein [Candidatus Eisenbacteria bacterium]MBU1948727.1 hypothetical protein [Candidatus Eisenbacteria bacterium]MBU2691264.1 hypothetical protein [Candidatus Eisenbacteria bacterium]